MIKGKGTVRISGGVLFDEKLRAALDDLVDDGEYKFLIVDEQKNPNMPYLNYLFSVVLATVSQSLPDHPSTKSLYRYFEELFAPSHTCTIDNQRYEYRDLKSERVNVINNFIERVIEYSQNKWNIEIPSSSLLRDAEYREYYSQAYLGQEAEWASFISSIKNKN